MTVAAAARWMGNTRPTQALCLALCLMLCALASCASKPELREQTPPPEPPFLGCTQSLDLYVAQEQSLQSHRLDVSLKLEAGQGPSLQARWLLEAEQPVQALRLRLRPGLELDWAMLRQDGRALAPACERWLEQGETALLFEEAVTGPFELELHYHSEQLAWKRELPLEQPVLVSYYAEFGEQLYLSSEDWYPRLPGVQAVAAGALTVEFPKQCLLGASGKPLSDTTKGELRSRVFELDPPLPEQLSMGVVVLCGGERLVPEKPLASTGVELLRQKQAAAESFSVRTLDILVAELDKTLGQWPYGAMTLASLEPAEDELFSAHGGLMLISPRVLDGAQGASFVFDLLARQYLSLGAPIDPRLLEGMIRYLGLRWGLREGSPGSLERLQGLKQEYLDALAENPKQDLALTELTVFDPMYLPIVYAKAVLIMRMLDLAVGDERFEAAMRDFVKGDGALKTRGVDELQRAFEDAAGQSFAAFFDRFFRGTGLVEVDAKCKKGELTLKQRREPVYPLRLTLYVGDQEQPLQVDFDEKGRWSTALECPKRKLKLHSPEALVRFRE